MIIEVTGTGTRNKGAELMLVAIRDHFARMPGVQLAVDQFFGTYLERARYGLLQKVALKGSGRSRLALALMPDMFRRTFGLVRDQDVDVLLDAAGFAFGDQHPPERTVEFAQRVEAAKAAGKKVVLMPQAFGPFEQPVIRKGFERIVTAADLVFVRDDISLQHVHSVVGNDPRVRKAPDFTNLVKPALSVESDASRRVCIVPNQRMVEKARTEADAAAYASVVSECIVAVEGLGLQPVLLLHGSDDINLATDIQRCVGREFEVHQESDPVVLKRFLGESHLVIGSRFHALVSALSQGVPTIGTSWSHKYEILFRDYGCEELLLPVPCPKDRLMAAIETTTGPRRPQVVRRLQENGERLVREVREMWRLIDDTLKP